MEVRDVSAQEPGSNYGMKHDSGNQLSTRIETMQQVKSVRDVIPTPDLRIGTGSPDRPDPRRALIGGACR
jgi:hypothetical protein